MISSALVLRGWQIMRALVVISGGYKHEGRKRLRSRGCEMGTKSRTWINRHRRELEEKYPGKVVIVREDEIVKVLDPPVGILEINDLAAELCPDGDWSYTFLCREEESIL